ncbi:MAG: glycosyltransferase family 2 protein [Armatimonadaceae bacterium]
MSETVRIPDPASEGRVCAIVPAWNEATRITSVLDVLCSAPAVDRIVVVDDGSSDRTAEVVLGHDAAVSGRLSLLRLETNQGKGAAMSAGAGAAGDAHVLLFLDADLIGLTTAQVEALVSPVRSGQVEMALGVFRGGNFWTTLAQVIVPNISGQRAIRRDLFESVPGVAQARFGVELAITNHVLGEGHRIAQVVLQDVSHPMKERKLGVVRGVVSRARMYQQMLPYMVRRYRRRGR